MGRASRSKGTTLAAVPTATPADRGGDVVGQVDAADLAEYQAVFAKHKQAHETLMQAQQVFVETQGAVKHVGERIAIKHQMGPDHAMDLETGRITRKASA